MSYYHTFWRNHDREDYECPLCGDADGPFEVHHRNGLAFDDRLDNLVALCDSCHRQVHREEEFNRVELDDWMDAFRGELLDA